MQPQVYSKKLEPEEYIGKALDNILLFSSEVVKMPSFDLDVIQEKKKYLVNEVENLCIGAGYINREKKKFDATMLDEAEMKLFNAAKEYFSSKDNIFGINVETKAMNLLSEAVEGRYDNKIARAKTILEEKVAKKELTKFEADMQLENLRLQLIIEAIEFKKGKTAEFGL